MTSVIDPSFLVELGAYAVAAAGIRLLKHRISRTRQQDSHGRPLETSPPEKLRAVGLGQAGGLPAPSTSLTRSRSPPPASPNPQAPTFAAKDAVDSASSEADPVCDCSTCCNGTEGHTGACDAMVDAEDAVNDPDDAMDVPHKADTPSVGAGAGQVQMAKLQTVSLEGDNEAAQQQRLVCATHKEDEQLPCSDGAAAEAVLPVGRPGCLLALESDVVAVTTASRGADDPAVGGAQESLRPAQHTLTEEEGDVDIVGMDDRHSDAVTVDDPPASALPMASPASRDDDIISDSEASKHDIQAVSDEEEVSGGDTAPDGDDHSVAASRGILLTAIQKRMRTTEHGRHIELFHSERRAPGPWTLKGKDEASKDIAQQYVFVKDATPAPAGGGSAPPSAAQPNDLLQEIACVTLRLLAGALHQNPTGAAQHGPTQPCQAVTEQPEQSPTSESSESKSDTPASGHHPEGEEEESQVSMSSRLQADSHSPARTQMPPQDLLDQSHHWASQPDQDVALPFVRQQEANLCRQADTEQPVQAMDIVSSAEEADQEDCHNSIQGSDWAVDTESSGGEAEEQLAMEDASAPGPTCGRLPTSTIWKRLVKKLQGEASPAVAPQLPLLSSHDDSHSGAPTDPGTSPAAESPSDAFHAEADDFEQDQLSPATDAMDSVVQPVSSVGAPDLPLSQSHQLEQIHSGDYGSQGLCDDQPETNNQTDWAHELPLADSAPPVDVNSPPCSLSPPSSPAWGSPHKVVLKSPAGYMSRASRLDWGSACGPAPDSPVYESTCNSPSHDSACGPKPFGQVWSTSVSGDTPNGPNCSSAHQATPSSPVYDAPDSPPRFSAPRSYVRRNVWSSYRAARSPAFHRASPERSPAWQSPGRTASRSPTPGMASPVSPWQSPPRAARNSPSHHSSLPTSCGSPASQSELLSQHLTQTSGPSRWSKSPSQDKAEGTVAPLPLPLTESLSRAVRAERAQLPHTEPAEEEEVEEGHAGQPVEGDIPAVKQIYFPLSVSRLHALSDKLRDTRKPAVADELYELSEEGGSVHARAVVQEQQAEAESAFDSAEDDERLCGTRAIAANSPEPEVMLGNGPEEDCMWEEQEAEGEDDDGVQFISETGPDPSKSAFQMARKRLASMRASRSCGRYDEEGEEEDVELYPGVQELITATLHSPHQPTHALPDFAAELSQSSSIRRHFKRLRKLAPAGKVCEPAESSAFWTGHAAGPSACSPGSGAQQPQAEASAWTDRQERGGKHDRHHRGKRGRKSDHGHGRRGRWSWLAEASAAAGGHRDEMMEDEDADQAGAFKN